MYTSRNLYWPSQRRMCEDGVLKHFLIKLQKGRKSKLQYDSLRCRSGILHLDSMTVSTLPTTRRERCRKAAPDIRPSMQIVSKPKNTLCLSFRHDNTKESFLLRHFRRCHCRHWYSGTPGPDVFSVLLHEAAFPHHLCLSSTTLSIK